MYVRVKHIACNVGNITDKKVFFVVVKTNNTPVYILGDFIFTGNFDTIYY